MCVHLHLAATSCASCAVVPLLVSEGTTRQLGIEWVTQVCTDLHPGMPVCRSVLLLWRNINNWLGVVLTLAPAVILLCIQPYFNSLFTKVFVLVLLFAAVLGPHALPASISQYWLVCSASGDGAATWRVSCSFTLHHPTLARRSHAHSPCCVCRDICS